MNVKKNLFLIIVALLAVATFALLFLNNDNTPNPSQNGEIKSTETSPAVPGDGEYEELSFPDNTLDTSDWETYHNEEFGFEVRYPKTWGVTTRTKEEIQEINPSTSFLSSFVGSVGFDTHEPYSGVSILVYNQNVGTLVEERGWTHFKDPGPGPSVKAQINNIETYYFLRKGTNEIYPGVYFLGDSEHGFEVTHTTSDDNEKAFQQMLLSFKLLK